MPAPVNSIDQVNFRFRNDDGNQATATWKANETTNISLAASVTFRLRIKYRDSSGITGTLTGALSVSKNGGGYAAITTSSTVVKLVSSSNVTDGTATTEQLTTLNTFVAGSVDSNGTVTSVNLNNQCTEMEWVLQIVAANVTNGDTLDFRDTNIGGSTIVTPRITVGAASYTLAIGQGSYTYTGQTSNLNVGHRLTLTQGSYNLNGQTIVLNYSGAGGGGGGGATITSFLGLTRGISSS